VKILTTEYLPIPYIPAIVDRKEANEERSTTMSTVGIPYTCIVCLTAAEI